MTLKEHFINIGIEPISYSGRGMYGKQCIGIVASLRNFQKHLTEIIKQCLEDFADASHNEDIIGQKEQSKIYELIDELFNYSTDNMGLDYVYYWPSIEWEEDGPSDEECLKAAQEEGFIEETF